MHFRCFSKVLFATSHNLTATAKKTAQKATETANDTTKKALTNLEK